MLNGLQFGYIIIFFQSAQVFLVLFHIELCYRFSLIEIGSCYCEELFGTSAMTSPPIKSASFKKETKVERIFAGLFF
jgi:hypothetical protein